MHRTLLLAVALCLSSSALADSIPPIPADLQARADALRAQVSPVVLTWAADEGRALAKGSGKVDVPALRQEIVRRFPPETATISSNGITYTNLGSMGDADVMALCFIVMMEAAKSAREDLKAIMDGVKAINKEKEGFRKVSQLAKATPTPAPGRVALLVAAARSVADKTHGANLARVSPRQAAKARH